MPQSHTPILDYRTPPHRRPCILATATMLLAISVLLGPAALITGIFALRLIAASKELLTGRAQATVGLVLGAVSTCLYGGYTLGSLFGYWKL